MYHCEQQVAFDLSYLASSVERHKKRKGIHKGKPESRKQSKESAPAAASNSSAAAAAESAKERMLSSCPADQMIRGAQTTQPAAMMSPLPQMNDGAVQMSSGTAQMNDAAMRAAHSAGMAMSSTMFPPDAATGLQAQSGFRPVIPKAQVQCALPTAGSTMPPAAPQSTPSSLGGASRLGDLESLPLTAAHHSPVKAQVLRRTPQPAPKKTVVMAHAVPAQAAPSLIVPVKG
ncbi:MAG: hypothetical protein SGPRY_009824, partial [Prymnesium sp.]